MKYDFDNIADRRNINSTKWTVKDNELPMWVADQDFIGYPKIKEAILRRTERGAFGYQEVPKSIFINSANWFNRRYNCNFNPDNMMFCEGVVATITSTIRHLLKEGDNVTLLTPVYNIFYNSIINNNCHPIEVELIKDDNLDYSIDFKALEEAFKISKLFILCNPHNPTGKIYTKEELAKIGRLANLYNIIVISDEIHCDFMHNIKDFTSFQSVNEVNAQLAITCISPSKTFNVAGLKAALIHIKNKELFAKVNKAINHDEVAEPNSFACDVIDACYLDGDQYVLELNEYIYQNKLIVKEFVDKYLPKVKYLVKDALYLAWLDLSLYNIPNIADVIREKSGLYLSSGSIYGKGGNYFVRMNLATSHSLVEKGLTLLKEALKDL